jgi:flagellar protein FlaJ
VPFEGQTPFSVAAKHKGLEESLIGIGVKESPYDFVKKMFTYAAILSVAIAVSVAILLLRYGLGLTGIVLAILLGFAIHTAFFQKFILYPIDRGKTVGKGVERDILFAARDLVVSLRSGMPLFNAFTAVSTGYGEASKEFARIVELVQLGMPIEQAIDNVSERSESKTFKLLMLQASGSIKAGADLVGALQGAVEDATQERVIELRRYGQRLNALAMFYMLFGVIFPSMGIAVAAILTTFVSIISITPTTLIFAIVGILFLQVIFLNIMRGSRPVFAM